MYPHGAVQSCTTLVLVLPPPPPPPAPPHFHCRNRCGNLQDAVGSRVTLVLEHGHTVRVDVRSAPAGRLALAACQALAEVLPPATWHAMNSKYILRRGRLQD